MLTNCVPSSLVKYADVSAALDDFKRAVLKTAKIEISFIKKIIEAHVGSGAYLQLRALGISGVNKDVTTFLESHGLLTPEATPDEVSAAVLAPYVDAIRSNNRFDLYDDEMAAGMVLANFPLINARMVKCTAAKESGSDDPPFSYAHKIHYGRDKKTGRAVSGGYGLMALVPKYHAGPNNPEANPKQYTKEMLLASITANVEVGAGFIKQVLRSAGNNPGLAFEFYGPNALEARVTRRRGISTNAMNNTYRKIYGEAGPW